MPHLEWPLTASTRSWQVSLIYCWAATRSSGGPIYGWWPGVATLVFGAAFVRVSIPGGLALAIAGLLALQSISLHNASHLYGQVVLLPQFARALFAGLLVALAYFGWDSGAEAADS